MTTKKIFILLTIFFSMLTLIGCRVTPGVVKDDYQKVLDLIEIGYAFGDAPHHVTQDLTLPTQVDTEIAYESIGWTSSQPTIINANGVVTRQSQDVQVILAVSVTIDGQSKEKVILLTVIADASLPTFLVTFDSNGGTAVDSQTVASGSTLMQPSNPVRAGYTFIAWQLNGVNFDFNQTVTANITLYALWQVIPTGTTYNVSFNTGGGSSVLTQTVNENGSLIVPNAPTRGTDQFVGWYKDFELKQPWNFVSDVVTGNITLYALWSLADVPLISGRTITFQDEFDGDTLNLSKWDYQNGNGAEYGIPGWGNGERQYYRTENVEVSNGTLKIYAKMENFSGSSYTSGKIVTLGRHSQTYGRIETRLKAPLGQGFWPAFWMMPANNTYGSGWPHNGEIDIMEMRGRFPTQVTSAIHFQATWNQHHYLHGAATIPGGGTIDQFHVYAVEWSEGKLEFSVNGHIYHTQQRSWRNNETRPFDHDFYIILNLAIGGHFDGNRVPGAQNFPASLEVDYVRAYSGL